MREDKLNDKIDELQKAINDINVKMGGDIRVIKNDMKHICNSIKDIKDLDNRLDKVEQKTSVFATFNTILTVVAGFIATYLGSKK